MEFKQSDGMKQTNNGENRTTNCQDVARPIEKRKFVCVNPSVYSFVSISTRKERSKEGMMRMIPFGEPLSDQQLDPYTRLQCSIPVTQCKSIEKVSNSPSEQPTEMNQRKNE